MGGWAGKLNTRSKLGNFARERNKQTYSRLIQSALPRGHAYSVQADVNIAEMKRTNYHTYQEKIHLRSNSLRSNERKLFYAFNSLYEQTSNYKRLGWILLQSIPRNHKEYQ